jgi:hypothetical protein
MRAVRVIREVDGERVVVRAPVPEPEEPVAANPEDGTEASNPPGSFEALYVALCGGLPPLAEEG